MFDALPVSQRLPRLLPEPFSCRLRKTRARDARTTLPPIGSEGENFTPTFASKIDWTQYQTAQKHRWVERERKKEEYIIISDTALLPCVQMSQSSEPDGDQDRSNSWRGKVTMWIFSKSVYSSYTKWFFIHFTSKNVRIQNKLQPKYLFLTTCIQYTSYLFTDPLLLTVLTGSLLDNSVEKNYIGSSTNLKKLKDLHAFLWGSVKSSD